MCLVLVENGWMFIFSLRIAFTGVSTILADVQKCEAVSVGWDGY